MKTNDLISIVVPVYKVEKYLRKCIDSILAQTYKNIEVILVDDGSPDGCPEICDEYAKKDKRIKVVHKQNGGVASARNSGLDIATSEWISFVDPDDYIHPKMYEILLSNALKKNADVSECGFFYVFENQEPVIDTNSKNELLVFDFSNQKEREKYVIDNINFTSVWRRLFKKEIFKNLRFPVGKIYEDAYIFLEWVLKAKRIVFTKQKLYFYLIRNDSIMGKTKKKRSLDFLDVVDHTLKKAWCNELKSKLVIYFIFVVLSMLHNTKAKKDKEYISKIKNWLKQNKAEINHAKSEMNFKERIKYFIYKNKMLWKLKKTLEKIMKK